MPPPSSAASLSVDNDADPPTGISLSRPAGEEEHGDGNDDEEEEYEEIEVEEEEEIEEEVEVEEEEEGEEDISDTSKQATGKRDDISQVMDFEGNDRQSGSQSTPEKSELRLHSDSLVEDRVHNSKFSGPSNEPFTMEDESHVNCEDSKCIKSGEHLITTGKDWSQESVVKKDTEASMIKEISEEGSRPQSGMKAHLCNSKVMAAVINSQLTNEASNALAMKDLSDMEPNDITGSEEEVKSVELQSEDDKDEIASRLLTSEIRTRSLSPSSEFKDQNKRPAVMCDFFAKGWCIRGSSCRFLHIDNKADNTTEQLEGDTSTANFLKHDQLDKGLRNIMLKPKLPGEPDPVVSSIGHDAAYSCHLTSERSFELKNEESKGLQSDDKLKSSSLLQEDLSRTVHLDTYQYPLPKDDLAFSSSKDVGIENLRQYRHTADYGSRVSSINRGSSPSLQNSLLHEHRSYLSGSSAIRSNYRGLTTSSYLSSLENQTYIRAQVVHGTKLDVSLSSGGILPSHQISAWAGPSFSFNSSLNASPLGSQKLLDNDRDYHLFRSSLLQSASPLSSSDRENLPLTNVAGDLKLYAKHKVKISSNDWEPSVPFRPSFLVTPTLASPPKSQYDPLRDSIDLPATGYRLPFKFSFVSQGTSSINTSHQPAYGNSLVSWGLGPENDDKNTLSFHSKFHENMLDKNCYTPGKVMGTSVVDGNKETTPDEENASCTGYLKDVPNARKIDVSDNSAQQDDGPRHKKVLKLDRVRQKSEMEVDKKTDGESKAMRQFRAALIDFVKELLKPTWREGRLSKNAHNAIVKKAVEKVLSTLQPHQIPVTTESIKQYLSLSQPKITKLVEGYCTKYGKS